MWLRLRRRDPGGLWCCADPNSLTGPISCRAGITAAFLLACLPRRELERRFRGSAVLSSWRSHLRMFLPDVVFAITWPPLAWPVASSNSAPPNRPWTLSSQALLTLRATLVVIAGSDWQFLRCGTRGSARTRHRAKLAWLSRQNCADHTWKTVQSHGRGISLFGTMAACVALPDGAGVPLRCLAASGSRLCLCGSWVTLVIAFWTLFENAAAQQRSGQPAEHRRPVDCLALL